MTNKSKGLFDHIDEIYINQRTNYFDVLSDAEKKTYNNFMVNKFISMNPHQLPIVNEIQKYNLDSNIHYLFYSQLLPKGKQFNKYIKKTKDIKYEEWLVEIVIKHFNVSTVEAEEYLEIYYKQNKSALRMLCETYGVDSKRLKKAKL